MIHLSQLLSLTRLEFVSKHHESGDIYTFHFKATRPIKQIAGQHGLFILPQLRGFHPFSLTSAPEEEHVMVGTHVREGSRYKQYWAALKPGDPIYMFGPILNFTLEQPHPTVVMIAQGIGITPFRSMLVHKKKADLPLKTILIHVDGKAHTYQELTESIADEASYPVDKEAFDAELTSTVHKTGDVATYYISGSPRFVRSVRRQLRSFGVRRRNIRKDGFLGY
jgi:ferredoxin-NADP reductase